MKYIATLTLVLLLGAVGYTSAFSSKNSEALLLEVSKMGQTNKCKDVGRAVYQFFHAQDLHNQGNYRKSISTLQEIKSTLESCD